MDIILYLTKVSKRIRKENRLNISRKFFISFGQFLLCQLVVRKVAPFPHLDGSVDLLHPVVSDVL